jgi:outer membrane scaffolding protein for murein synthesis (MipA/OmpV family)
LSSRCTRILAAIVMALPLAAHAADEPLWEAGLGIATVYLPDYRGSDHSRGYALPMPYFIYRGDFFKSDREGVRAAFYKDDRIDFHLSAGASLPISSDNNPVRAGMPDLKPSVELGPAMDWRLWRSGDRKTTLELRFPLRFAVTVESHPEYVGAQLSPNLNVDVTDPFGFAGWNLGMLTGPIFTDSRYNRHYYGVPAEFATSLRPEYAPKGGFGGWQFIAALSKRFPKYWVGGFLRYDTLQGAVYGESPLVTSKRYAAGGIAIAWILGESKERVPVDLKGRGVR